MVAMIRLMAARLADEELPPPTSAVGSKPQAA